ncbi:MAG: hypothetical protein MI867_25345 [Pseudomonadales bacterium]|nr:hypothetical protein [Pseudomonadales bacterium]
MDSDEILFKEAETYTNSIVAFSVFQGLAYAFYFGTNSVFNCHVKSANLLAESLVVMFIVVAFLCSYAIYRLGKVRSRLNSDHSDLVISFAKGKIVVVMIFGFFPAALTFFYAVNVVVPSACQALIS